MNIANQVALVTGCSRGIGLALCKALLLRGVRHVYATSRNGGKPAGLDDDRVTSLRLDVTSEPQVKTVSALASDVNLLINNAGIMSIGAATDITSAQLTSEFATNCIGLSNVVRNFAPIIEQNGGGAIVNVLSISALASSPGLASYSASKAAAWSLTQAMQTSLSQRRIRVFAAFPGPVDTELARDFAVKKASARDVASAILDGVEAEEEEIFPDDMARQAAALWSSNPKQLQKQFALL